MSTYQKEYQLHYRQNYLDFFLFKESFCCIRNETVVDVVVVVVADYLRQLNGLKGCRQRF